MASNRQSPLWNQDAIMAAGLAFAGMTVLQSTLLRDSRLGAWRAACVELFGHFVNWHAFAWWWGAILIVAGVVTVAALVVRKVKASSDERALWHEATTAPDLR